MASSKVQTQPLDPQVQAQIEAIRACNRVANVAGELEGSPLASLPDHVYGFTYSPLNESTPLFATRSIQSFEVHRLAERTVRLLGFVKPAEAAALAKGDEDLDVQLYPEPHGDAASLVQVPLERILKARPVSRIDGNFMPLHLAAARV